MNTSPCTGRTQAGLPCQNRVVGGGTCGRCKATGARYIPPVRRERVPYPNGMYTPASTVEPDGDGSGLNGLPDFREASPGVQQILVMSDSDSNVGYPARVTITPDGYVTMACGCPNAPKNPDGCKHERRLLSIARVQTGQPEDGERFVRVPLRE